MRVLDSDVAPSDSVITIESAEVSRGELSFEVYANWGGVTDSGMTSVYGFDFNLAVDQGETALVIDNWEFSGLAISQSSFDGDRAIVGLRSDQYLSEANGKVLIGTATVQLTDAEAGASVTVDGSQGGILIDGLDAEGRERVELQDAQQLSVASEGSSEYLINMNASYLELTAVQIGDASDSIGSTLPELI